MQVRVLNDDADGSMTVVFNIESQKERDVLRAIHGMNITTPNMVERHQGQFMANTEISKQDVIDVMGVLFLAFK